VTTNAEPEPAIEGRTGESVPASGLWRAGPDESPLAFAAGDTFPPDASGQAATWTLDRELFDEDLPDPTEEEQAPLDETVEDVDADVPDDEVPTAQQTLRYYGVDFDVEGLVRRFGRGDLLVPSFDPAAHTEGELEGFQRRFVWPKKQMDRFVESLLLGYPVPGIFLVEQPNRRFLVLDGQQRLRTLYAFYEGRYGNPGNEKLFQLDFVTKELQKLTYKTLPEADKRLLDTTILQSTIVVPQSGGGMESVYRVFERINSSGIKLQPQEIRVALFAGPMIRLLRDLNGMASWRQLFGPPHSRLKDHELILRFLALLESTQQLQKHDWNREAARAEDPAGAAVYRPAMTTFLNRYLGRHTDLEGIDKDAITTQFEAVTNVLAEAGGRSILRFSGNQVNAAHTDAVMVGATIAYQEKGELTAADASAALASLLSNKTYRDAVVESTSHLESVTARIREAVTAFRGDTSA
jgi:hypothetical protein